MAPRSPRKRTNRGHGITRHGRGRRNVTALTNCFSYAAHACTVLGVDTASKSGFAIRRHGVLISSGEIDTKDRAAVAWVVQRAAEVAAKSCTELIVVLESAWGGTRATLLGLGAARERWASVLRELGLAKRRILSVMPTTWREPLGITGRRAQCRAMELAQAQRETGLASIGPDEAAAIGISRWAAHAARVARVLKPRG